jgi:hypothetical protein
MTEPTAIETPGHGREGSATCCHILMLLHRHPTNGLPAADIQVFLGLARQDLEQALFGLRTRRRIVNIGSRGSAGRWVLAQHAAQHAQDQCT